MTKKLTRQGWAKRALRNGAERAAKHIDNGATDKANVAWERAMKTANSWLDGTHPKIGKAAQ